MHRDGSSVMFPLGSGGFGSCIIRPPHPNDPVSMDLTPTPIPVANLRIHIRKNDHRNGSIYNFATANQS